MQICQCILNRVLAAISYKAKIEQPMERANSTSPAGYSDRIVTFIDLLAFAQDVLLLEERPRLRSSIEAVLSRIARCKQDLDHARRTRGTNYDARMTYFSDCLVISYRPDPSAALRALEDAAFIGQMVLRGGFLPRGAITLGKLSHDENIVYGAGLVEAHRLERDEVVMPRIAVTEPIRKMVEKDLSDHGCSDLLPAMLRDVPANPFVHILGNEWVFLKREREKEAREQQGSGVREMYEEMQQVLPIRHRNGANDRVKAKIEWLRDYVNASIDERDLPPSLKVNLENGPIAG